MAKAPDEKVVALKKPAAKKKAPAKKPVAKKAPTKKAAPKKAAKNKTSNPRSSKKVDEFLNKSAAAEKKAEAAKAEAGDNAQKALKAKIEGYHGELSNLQKAIKEMTGKKGSRVKTILEVEDWNRKGMSDIITIMNMSESARADFLRTFHPLFMILYKEEWESEMHDLLTQLEKESNPEADLQNDDEVDAEFKTVDVEAELAPAEEKPAENAASEEEDKAAPFEASAADLEAQLAED